MATTTPNIGLTKPDGAENYDLAVVNTNSDIVDAEITDAKAGSNTRVFKCKNDVSSVDNALNVQGGDGRYYQKTETYSQEEADVITDAIEAKVDENTAHIFGVNILINGQLIINQRNYDGSALSDGEYGYDRWAGANSDANIKQIVEATYISSGQYTISWVGGGTATIGTTSNLSSGDSVFLTSVNTDVIVPKGSTNIQLERGSRATQFEKRKIGYELLLCQRYYEKSNSNSLHISIPLVSTTPVKRIYIPYSVEKRTTPTLYFSGGTSVSIATSDIRGFRATVDSASLDSEQYLGTWTADAEI